MFVSNSVCRRISHLLVVVSLFTLAGPALAWEEAPPPPDPDPGIVVRQSPVAPPDEDPPGTAYVDSSFLLPSFQPNAVTQLTVGGAWLPQGPRPIYNGQVEGIGNGEVVGAVHAVAAHPTDPNILFVGAVNGGIWRTDNTQATNPTWVPLTDDMPSLSISALGGC